MAIRRAKGARSKAISDQSGFKIPYTSLKTQWDGLRVEPSEFDPKHPQLTPTKNIVDATALFNPRPDNDDDLTIFTVGYNYDIFADKQSRPGIGIRSVGGVDGGAAFVPLVVSGVGRTGAVGTEAIQLSIDEAGVGGTGGVGTESLETELAATGVAGTGATGNHGETNDEEIHLSIVESGVGGTGGVGDNSDIEPDLLGWGEGGWGSGTWGDG